MKSPDDVADQAQVSTPEVAKAEAPSKAEHSLEVEIKLGGDPEVLDRAWHAIIAARGSFSTKQLESTYFDTPDLRLRRRGFTLRVRHDGHRYVQTMKAEGDGDAGMTRRSEWTTPVRSRRPDLSKMADSGLMEQIGLILPEELQPLFTTKVTRRIKKRTISRRQQPKTVIEIALDQGEIIVNGKSEAISEIEFELLEGRPQALYEEAAKLHGKIPLRIETLSKAKRGFALAGGEHFAGQKAAKIELDPDISLGDVRT